MPGVIGIIDNMFGRLVRSRHPYLQRADRLFSKAFGQVRLNQPAPAAGPQIMMMAGNDPRDPVNAVFDSMMNSDVHTTVAVGGTVKGKKGTYQVISEFAEGGMAKIFLVKDEQGREHLLKNMLDFSGHPAEVQQQVRIRFANEASIMQSIDPKHPGSRHIVKVIDVDPHPLPVFYVMEKITGRDLATSVPAGKTLSPHLSLSLVIQVLDGLIAFENAAKLNAARSGRTTGNIAHRDIKPENILLEIEGKKVKRAVLADFGIVKLPGSDLTEMHQFIGTLAYSAPETIHHGGSKEAADQRSDIFALGAVLYWLFTGRDHITEEEFSAFAVDPDHFLDKLRPYRPPEVSPDMWDATFKAMAAKPEDRFQSYLEMRNALYQIFQQR